MKVILDTKEGRVLVGVQRPDTDPYFRPVDGVLDDALALVPSIVDEAEARWKCAPKNPKAPEPPKAEAVKPVVKTSPKVNKGKAKTARQEPEPPDSPPEPPEASLPQQDAPPVPEETAPEPVVVEPEVKAEELPALSETKTPEPETVAPVSETPEPTPAKTKRKYEKQDGFEYMLADGRGPFNSLNEVFCVLSLHNREINLPNHRRYEKLSAKLKAQIVQRVKGCTPEASVEPEEGMPEPERTPIQVATPIEAEKTAAAMLFVEVNRDQVRAAIAEVQGPCAWHCSMVEATLPMQLGDMSCPGCKRWWRAAR